MNITLAQDGEEIKLSVITTNEGIFADTGIYDSERIQELIKNIAEHYMPDDEWRVTW